MFYFKIASQNIKKSIRVFTPFILSSMVLYVLLCSLFLLQLSPVSKTMGSGAFSLSLGIIVLMIFSTIMEIYSFNFLMKQRAREFGLYNMLGMNKKKVIWIATLELFIILTLVIVVGSILSGVFSNSLYLIFANLTQYYDLRFTIDSTAFVMNTFIFIGIFIILELMAIRIIGKTSPLILFRTAEKGEKEPKGNLLLAMLSLVGLGTGYFISLTSKGTGITLIFNFFIAVICVIIGTYLFYISFMTWYLKKRRKNKKYFYTPEHLVTTSQMIFRMKQHATGLANMTLLAVMAFVTIATTTSLYTGLSSQINSLYPKETALTYYVDSRQQGEDYLDTTVLKKLSKQSADKLSYLTFYAEMTYDNNIASMTSNQSNPNTIKYTNFITQDDFKKLGHSLPTLLPNQVAFYNNEKSQLKQVVVGNKTFENIVQLERVNFPDIINMYNATLVVVSDDSILKDIDTYYTTHISKTKTSKLKYRVFMDLTNKDIEQVGSGSAEFMSITNDKGEEIGNLIQRSSFKSVLLGFTGGFLFTGFLLGSSFLLGAALIMYYKQYSEGYEDKKSYNILQEVGMSKQDIKRTINKQTLMLFFMPVVIAVIHFVIALVMLKQLLSAFGVASSLMIYAVSAVTIGVICLLYYVMYKWTSRTYYRIIERHH